MHHDKDFCPRVLMGRRKEGLRQYAREGWTAECQQEQRLAVTRCPSELFSCLQRYKQRRFLDTGLNAKSIGSLPRKSGRKQIKIMCAEICLLCALN